MEFFLKKALEKLSLNISKSQISEIHILNPGWYHKKHFVKPPIKYMYLWSFSFAFLISIGYRINVSAIKDLYYEWYLKILPKLHKILGECNLKEFSNIIHSVNP